MAKDLQDDTTMFTKLEICEALGERFCKNCSSPCSICKIHEAIIAIARMEKKDTE